LARENFLHRRALPDLSLAVNVEGMLAEIDTNKRNVLHDGLLHKETPCQRTAHRVVGTISLAAFAAFFVH